MRAHEFLADDMPTSPMAPLYHTSPIINAIHIVEKGAIEPRVPPEGKNPDNSMSGKPSVSLTRDPRLDFYTGKGARVTFVIDQTKLRSLMKVHPISFKSTKRRESEERVYKSVPLDIVDKLIVPRFELEQSQELKQMTKDSGSWINDKVWDEDSYGTEEWMLDQIVQWADENDIKIIEK